MSTLSTHVLDIEAGRPAAGVDVALWQGDRVLARAVTDADGRIAHLGDTLTPGGYRLVFSVAAYYAARGQRAAFLQRLSVDFLIDPSQPHYHVPLLLAPYACTTYRGS